MTWEFSANTVIARKNDLPSTSVDNDLVILSLASNNYVGLDAVGRKIWESIETPCRVDQLCQLMSSSFSGAPSQIGNDVIAFLKELAEEGLIDVSDQTM